jgi:predicted nucleic acid-binding protein
MKFWDSSAVVPLLVSESRSDEMRSLAKADDRILWLLSEVEVSSALWRRKRGGALADSDLREAETSLRQLLSSSRIVLDVSTVMSRTRRLFARHDLRAADALQLAAALLACDDHPEMLPFVTLDERLAEAAAGEGFPILPERERA